MKAVQRCAVVVVLGLVLVLRALQLRIPQLARPIWRDEVRHNEVVLSSLNMAELTRLPVYKAMFQPRLDFWLRHEVWFPLFGANERAMRIPPLVFGVVLVVLVYAALLSFFSSRLRPSWAAVLAFVASFWIVNHETQIYYSAEARHYSLVSLASTLWFVALLLYQGKPRWFLALASMLFINTHYFALPLVAAGYGLQILRELRARRYAWIFFHVLTCLLIYECTIRFNWEPLAALLHRPPGTKHLPLSGMFTWPQLEAGLSVWRSYLDMLEIPVYAGVTWGIVLVAAVLRRRARWVPLLLVVLLVLPAFFVYLRYRSSYPIVARYYTPFFGAGLITLVAVFDVAMFEWQRLAPYLSPRLRRMGLVLAMLGFLWLFRAPAFMYRVVSEWRTIHGVPKNGSPYYLTYSGLARENVPVLIIQSQCGDLDMTDMYYHSIIPLAEGSDVTWIQLGCAGTAKARQTVRQFLATGARRGGLIVLDQKQADCAGRTAPQVEPPAQVSLMLEAAACVWKVAGATTPAQLAGVAAAVGFKAARHIR